MSAEWLNNNSCLYKMNEDDLPKNPVQKQGIVSILSSDFNSSKKIIAPHNCSVSIRRTLSADMSSPKWLQTNGFPHSSIKRVQSSEQLLALGEQDNNVNDHDHDHDDKTKGPAFEDIWSTIQADKRSWGAILSPPKNNDGCSGSESGLGLVPAPYVHPLAKRTASSLSEKSLEICTESLGSETGSDVFSYPASEPEDSDKELEVQEQGQEQEQEQEQQQDQVEVKDYNMEVGNFKYNNYYRGPTSKRSMMVPPTRPSFPPPLPSLAHRDDGSNLHIRSHRQDGRLVVEAVSVPSPNCFRAQRQDGRLLLTLTSDEEQEQEHEDAIDDDEEEEDVVKEGEIDGLIKEQVKEKLAIPTRGVINVPKSCTSLTMSKLMELTSTRNKSTWPRNYNTTTTIKTLDENNHEIEEEDTELAMTTTTTTTTQSLPPRPRVSTATAAAVALNAYEYYWRRSDSPAAAAVAMLKPLAGKQQQNNKKCAPQVEKDTKKNINKSLFAAHNKKGVALGQEEVVLVKAARREGGVSNNGEKGEYLVPLMLRGCKEHKRSLLFWEPYCIATS